MLSSQTSNERGELPFPSGDMIRLVGEDERREEASVDGEKVRSYLEIHGSPELWGKRDWMEFMDADAVEKHVQRLVELADALIASGADRDEVENALEQSVEFSEDCFRAYDNAERDPDIDDPDKPMGVEIPFTFVVPTRLNGTETDGEGTEVAEVQSILGFKGIPPDIRLRAFTLPPFSVSQYRNEEGDLIQGRVMYAPVSAAMFEDDPARGLTSASEVLAETITSATERFGLKGDKNEPGKPKLNVGLGATLPLVMKYANPEIKQHLNNLGVETTTGHGGTVHLLVETVRGVIDDFETESEDGRTKIGVLGAAGSIGSSSAAVIVDRLGGEVDIMLSDLPEKQRALRKKAAKIQERVAEIEADEVTEGNEYDPPIVEVVEKKGDGETNEDLTVRMLEKSTIIVSAITDILDLDAIEKRLGRKIDLTGKVIVDDSQPAAFIQEQVVARGGAVLWVVGEGPDIRDNGFNYGGEGGGFVGAQDVWGCEAEVCTLSAYEKPPYVQKAVTAEIANDVGALMKEQGFGPARRQAFGILVPDRAITLNPRHHTPTPVQAA